MTRKKNTNFAKQQKRI